MNSKPHLVIGVTGSVATIKLAQLVSLLQPHFEIKIVSTKHVNFP